MKHLLTILLTTLTITTALAQDYRWAHGFGTSNGDSHGTGIATDANGNVYVAGTHADTIDFDPGLDTANIAPGGFIAKYDSTGLFQWAVRTAYNSYSTLSIAVNATGVYATGCFNGTFDFDPSPAVVNLTANWADIFLIKFDLNGNFVWVKQMGGANTDVADAIAIDNLGNSYITGYFHDTLDFNPNAGVATIIPNSAQDMYFAKYDSNGNYVWAKNIGALNNSATSHSISVDPTGVVISGLFSDTMDFNPSAATNLLIAAGGGSFLAKYDTSGNYQWAFPLAYIMKHLSDVSGNGDIYVCGGFNDTMDFDPGIGVVNLSTVNGAFFMAKYNINGNYLWAKGTGGLSGGGSFVLSMCQDAGSSLYLTGWLNGTVDFDPIGTFNLTAVNGTSGIDIFFAKYDSNFNFYWARSIGGAYYDRGYGITIDQTGSIYITGYFTNSIDADPGTGVVTLYPAISENILIAKYDNTLTNILNSNPNEIAELAVYPNPATDHLQISFTKEIECQIIISNAIGQAVYTQTIQNQSCAQTNLTGYPAGVYYVKVWGKGFSSYKRIVVVG